jgi:7-cyano-7-deazaguanine synthase
MKSVVLLSGGIDSATCLWMARSLGPVTALTVDYGQHAAEVERRISVSLCSGIGASHRHVQIRDIANLSSSALTGSSDASIAANAVVPGRNALLASLGAALATTIGADIVWIGCNKTDADNFPDCTAQFLSALSDALSIGYGIELRRPLVDLTKTEVVATAFKLGVPVGATSSCYYGSNCGNCSACKIRKTAMKEAL